MGNEYERYITDEPFRGRDVERKLLMMLEPVYFSLWQSIPFGLDEFSTFQWQRAQWMSMTLSRLDSAAKC